MKLIYQILYVNKDYLFFRCLKKPSEKEKTETEKEIVEVLQQATDCKKKAEK